MFATGTASLTSCTINNNQAAGGAGGLVFQGTSLNLSDSTISGNIAGGATGGAYIGVNTGGSISNCTISGNSSASFGGGLTTSNSSSGSILYIFASTIAGNHAGGDGGGIRDSSFGSNGVFFVNSTISGNTSSSNGGGIAFEGSSAESVNAVTITGNSAVYGGGAYEGSGGNVVVHDTVCAGNTAQAVGPDFDGPFSSSGHNFVGISQGNNFSSGFGNDQVGSGAFPKNPLLGPLENNGGPTSTRALMPGSTAIGANLNNDANIDQRGFARPGAGQSGHSLGAFEFQLPAALGNTPQGTYVENLYETLLARTADAGAAGWVTALRNGASPSAVVQGLESSTEYHTIEVQKLYHTYLHRAADAGGLQNWVHFLSTGGTVEQVATAFVGSAEYFQLHGDSNDAFLTALYLDALGRGGTPAEQAGFLRALNSGTASRGQVAAIIFASAECKSDLVQSIYRADLGRPADPMGLAAWLSNLLSGMTDETFQADVLGSGEAFANRS